MLNKERIEKLETSVEGLQEGVNQIEIRMENMFLKMENKFNKLIETNSSNQRSSKKSTLLLFSFQINI